MKSLPIAALPLLCLTFLPSCIVVPEGEDQWYCSFSEIMDFSEPPPQHRTVRLPFRYGDLLDWDTGASNGVMKVVRTDSGRFKLEQYNSLNKKAGNIQMEGELFADGTCRIENPTWDEVWIGNLYSNSIVGKVNNLFNFKITWRQNSYANSLPPTPRFPFAKGDTIRWQLGTGRGSMKVLSVKDNKFVVDKYDDFNKKAKPVRMEGELDSKGVCKIKNPHGKEIWNGKLDINVISGKANNGSNFKVSRSTSVLDMPFKQGDKLPWSFDSQKGTMKVVSVSSNGKFAFEMYNDNRKYVKNDRISGEILPDGTYKMKNSKGDAVWIGVRNGAELSGKINNKSTFKIRGLK